MVGLILQFSLRIILIAYFIAYSLHFISPRYIILKTEESMSNNFFEQAKVTLQELREELVAIASQMEELAETRRKLTAQHQALAAFISASAPVRSAETPSVSEIRRVFQVSEVPRKQLVEKVPLSSLAGADQVSSLLPIFSRKDYEVVIDRSSASGHPRGSLKESVLRVVEEYLADGKPHPTKELVDVIQSHGVQISGADPVITVSSILSREKDKFSADRKYGWSFKEKSPNAEGTEASDET